MPLYNFALTPINKNISDIFIEISNKYFINNFDEYILGKEALPHITLVKFVANDDNEAINLYKNFKNKQQLMLKIIKHQYRLSDNKNKWAEFLIEKDTSLVNMQQSVYDYLNNLKYQAHPKSEIYNPHITLARVKKEQSIIPSLNDLPKDYKYKFRMDLGLSSETGRFIKRIKN